MTVKSKAGQAFDAVTAANDTALETHRLALQTAARNAWVNTLCKLAVCGVSANTQPDVLLDAATPGNIFDDLDAAAYTVTIGTVAEIQSGSGLAASNLAVSSVDFGTLTVTLASNLSRATTVNDILVIDGLYAPISAINWTTTSLTAVKAYMTVESMDFMYDNNSGLIYVKSVASAGETQWLNVGSAAALGQYLDSGQVT